MMWPLLAITEKLRPRNLLRVRDFAGDSTMTSALLPPLLPAAGLTGRFAGLLLAPPSPAARGLRVEVREARLRTGGSSAPVLLAARSREASASGGSALARGLR